MPYRTGKLGTSLYHQVKKVVADDAAESPEPFFSTPADIKDFKNPSSYATWSSLVSEYMECAIKRQEVTVGQGNSHYFNPQNLPGEETVKQTVTWNAFPRRLQIDYPDDYFKIADEKDGWPFDDMPYARNQDEYFEWFIHRDENGNIQKVGFTCESPEYYQICFDEEPETCLALYQKHVSKDVKLDDLKDDKGEYNIYNKWNTMDGCMHLNCPPNSLDAEVYLAADATILRKSCKTGEIITDSQELINCAQYGRATRNSDPHIGSTVNTLARDGYRLSLADPVALYIMGVKLHGWTLDGEDASKYMKLVRGTEKFGLRYELEVTDGKHTVSDILIGGVPITYAGQVAMLVNIGLVAEAYQGKDGPGKAYPCTGPGGLPDPGC